MNFHSLPWSVQLDGSCSTLLCYSNVTLAQGIDMRLSDSVDTKVMVTRLHRGFGKIAFLLEKEEKDETTDLLVFF